MASYGNKANVKTLTGIRASDLGFADDVALDAWLDARLAEVSLLIDRDRNRSDWAAKGWLPAINGIADRWLAALIRFAMAHRDSAIIRVDDFRVAVPSDNGPGKGVIADLHRFPKKFDAQAVSMNVISARALSGEEGA